MDQASHPNPDTGDLRGLPGKSVSHHLSSRVSRNSVQPCIESCHTAVDQMARVTGPEELQGKPKVTD